MDKIYMDKLERIIRQFSVKGTLVREIAPLGNGWINDTYKVTTDQEEYVLQRINNRIFPDVALMQDNILKVTSHIRKRLEQRGEKDISRKTLTVIPTVDGAPYIFSDGEYWRMTLYIKDSRTYEQITPRLARLTGKAFGDFHRMLSDLPAESLGYTIENFHNMEFRLEQFRCAMKENRAGRMEEKAEGSLSVKKMAEELSGRGEEMCKAERLGREGRLPRRITHCDTKVNNILFSLQDEFLCVIDLDTVMPGFVLSDFGDFIRTAGNTAAEDEPDTAKVSLNMEIFREFAAGYLETAREFLTPVETETLPFGAKLLTYMQTVRFLTDYLNGDIYYKIKYPEHNIVRSRAQFALLKSIESHERQMQEFIQSIL